MCGIAGFWNINGYANQEKLIQMGAAIRHRGPDNLGTYCAENIGLAHARLSIIDLSENANQPFRSRDGRYIMVYNGEVYNYKMLASQFGIEMRTNSDTEVVLELFAKIGVEFLNKLNGMFAMAIYDTHEDSLFVFRDRVGIKPVYFTWNNQKFLFASELKSLKKVMPNDDLEWDNEAISSYFHLGFIPSPKSIYKKINKLYQGHYVIVNKTGLHIRSWWDIENKINNRLELPEQEVLNRLDKCVNEAVSSRLISDVPLGTFLSGGVDSSLVSAVAAKHSSTKLQTFTIGFDHVKHDEAEFAKKIAKHINADHHLLVATEKEALDLLPEMIYQFDEPFGDTSAIPTMLVSKLAREHVTVTLSGDGGDELFMGYGSHVWAERMSNPLLKRNAAFIRLVLRSGGTRFKRAANHFYKTADPVAHIFSQEQYMYSQIELIKLLEFDPNPFNRRESQLKGMTPSEIQALFDFNYYLPDDLLVKVDRSSMKYALETRVPLLDYRIAELAFNLPQQYRLKGKTGKYILKRLLSKYVPEELFDRPKRGFSIPLDHWMRHQLKDWFDTYLHKDILVKHNIVNPEYVMDLQKKFTNPKYNFLYNRLWLVAAFHAWAEKQNS